MAEWTLATGTRLLFHRTDAEPGLVRVRAFAPGGWLALPDSLRAAVFQAADFAAEGALLQPRVTSTETRFEGEAEAASLDDLFNRIASLLTTTPGVSRMTASMPDAEDALEAALAGVDPRVLAGTTAPSGGSQLYADLFARPNAFTVVVVGDAGADVIEHAAGATLGRSLVPRGGAGGVPAADRPTLLPSRGISVELPADAGGTRVLVGFRARPFETLAERNPHDVLAGLDVLAALLTREAARALPDITLATKTDLQAGVATFVLDGTSRSRDAEALRDALLAAVQAAGGGFSDTALAEARGAARTRHDRRLASSEGWLDWLEVIAHDGDPRAPLQHARRLSAVTSEHVRTLARALLSVERAAVVLVDGE